MDIAPMLNPVRDLGEYIREQREAAQISLRALAAKAGVSNPYLSQVERGLRRPSASILTQIATGLSISAESLLVKAGILPAGPDSAVVSAIRADEFLTEHQKVALVEIYRSFRHDAGRDVSGADRADDEPAGTGSRAHRTEPHRTEPHRTEQ